MRALSASCARQLDAARGSPSSPRSPASTQRARSCVGRSREFRLLTLLTRSDILSERANAETRDASAVKGFIAYGPKLLCCARLLCMSVEALSQPKPVLAALAGHSVSATNDQAATALIAAKLEAARDALPTTLAQDRLSLASLHGGMATRMALRVAEKALLEESIAHIASQSAVTCSG